MKKLQKLFSVLLALAMLLTSTIALAEEAATIPLYCVNLSDVTMSMDGEAVLDLSGMTLSLGAGLSDSGSEGLLYAAALGGDDTAAEAKVALADNKIAINVEGMSAPLTLDLAEVLTEENIQAVIDALMAQFTEEELAALTKIYGAIMELTSEEGMAALTTGYETYLAEVETIITENMTMSEGVSNAFVVGPEEEISSTLVTITLDGDAMCTLMESVAKMYDSSPAIIELVNGLLMLEGEDVQITSYSELLEIESLRTELQDTLVTVGVYVSDDYDNGYIDVVATVSEADEDLMNIVFGIGVVEDVRVIMLAADEYGSEIYADFSMVESETYAGEVETSFYMSANEDGVEEELINMWVGPDPDYGTLGVVTIGPEGDSVGIAWGIGDSQIVLNIYDDYGTNMEIGFAVTGADTADAYLLVDDGDASYEIGATLGFSIDEVPVAEVSTLANTAGVNLMTITDEEIESITGELQGILINGAMVLMNNVPGLASLMYTE